MLQDIHQVSTIQRYPLGFKYPISNPLDLRGFRYAKAGGTLNPKFGAKNALPQHVLLTSIHAEAKAGDVLVAIDVKVTDGKNGDGIIDANELAGGYIVIFPQAANDITRMIVANTATTGAGVMVVTIDKPLPCDLGLTTGAECMANPYLSVKTIASNIMSVVGMPTVPAKINEYLWLQTWGPVWIAPSTEVSVGTNNRRVLFGPEGNIYSEDATNPNIVQAQLAGFVLANARDGSQGAAFIFLQITP